MTPITQLLQLAQDELATANLLLINDRYRACISRSYYAMYIDLARALNDAYDLRQLSDYKETVLLDEINDSYILMTLGWDRKARVHGCLVHLDIIDGKIWVQRDETEDGVTYESVLAESTELNCSRSSNDSRFKPDFSLYNGGDVSICCSGLLEGTLRNIPKLFF
jgi:hypothetical protein